MPKAPNRKDEARPVPKTGSGGGGTGRSDTGDRASRLKRWVLRLALAVGVPVVALIAGEVFLRLGGVGAPASFLVSSNRGDVYTTNQKFAVPYFGAKTVLRPFLFTIPKQKAQGVVRICVLGESAAMGTPDPSFGFGRILEVQLRKCYPGKRFEFMNAAMRGINSHVIRSIAAECMEKKPDAVVVYMGNNEVVGWHSPDPDSSAIALSLPVIRSSDWLRRTRLGQLVAGLVLNKAPENQDMGFFRAHRLPASDWRRRKVYKNFRVNLREILGTATGVGAQVLLCTVPVNLADCPPLISVHRPGLSPGELTKWEDLYRRGTALESAGQFPEAVGAYAEAAKIDGQFAELQYRLARCCLGTHDEAAAAKHFNLARDYDALEFRADSSINRTIREEALRAGKGVMLADLERAFSRSPLSADGVPGYKLFHDHVHPTFAGNYLIAVECLRGLEPLLGRAPGNLPTEQQCADALTYTLGDELNVVAAMVSLKSRPPFLDQLDHATRQRAEEEQLQRRLAAFGSEDAERCLRICREALQAKPEDWPLQFNLASLEVQCGQFSQAAQHFQGLVERYPQHTPFRVHLAAALLKSGDRVGAAAQLDEAARLDPKDTQVREAQQAMSRNSVPASRR